MLYGLYTSSQLPMGHVIRHASWSFYSHCAITDGNYVWEARAPMGVHRMPHDEWMEKYGHDLREINGNYPKLPIFVKDEAKVIQWMDDQRGARYDFGELVGHIIHVNLGRGDRFTCSSFFIEALVQDSPYMEHDEYYRMAPRNVRQAQVSFNNGVNFALRNPVQAVQR